MYFSLYLCIYFHLQSKYSKGRVNNAKQHLTSHIPKAVQRLLPLRRPLKCSELARDNMQNS